MCHFWDAYQDWDLLNQCDDEAEHGTNLRQNKTIDDLKNHAIEKQYDGLVILTDPPSEELADAVFYKKCGDALKNAPLSEALTYKPGVKTYLHVTRPCPAKDFFDYSDFEANPYKYVK